MQLGGLESVQTNYCNQVVSKAGSGLRTQMAQVSTVHTGFESPRAKGNDKEALKQLAGVSRGPWRGLVQQ